MGLARPLGARLGARGERLARGGASAEGGFNSTPVSEVSCLQQLLVGKRAHAREDLGPASHRVIPCMAQCAKPGAIVKGTGRAAGRHNVGPDGELDPMHEKLMLLKALRSVTVPRALWWTQVAHMRPFKGGRVAQIDKLGLGCFAVNAAVNSRSNSL